MFLFNKLKKTLKCYSPVAKKQWMSTHVQVSKYFSLVFQLKLSEGSAGTWEAKEPWFCESV